MKAYLVILVGASLLLSAAPATEESWTTLFFDWITGLFVAPAELDNPREAAFLKHEIPDAATLDLLNRVPLSDTLTVEEGWPYESVDVAADLDRRARLLLGTVVLQDSDSLLPLATRGPVRILYAKGRRPDRLIAMARRFTSVQAVAYSSVLAPALFAARKLPTVVVADDGLGRSDTGDHWYRALYGHEHLVLLHFGDLALLDSVPPSWAVMNCPQRAKESEAFIGQALFGAQSILGRADEGSAYYAPGLGQDLPASLSGYREPELLQVDRARLGQLDQIVRRAIRSRATPGAQLAVLRNGQIIYERAYGQQAYGRADAVTPGDLYDLASVTKAAATSLAVMKLYDEGRIDLSAPLSTYLPEYKRSITGRYRIDQLLAHHTGLQSDLPIERYLGKKHIVDQPSATAQLALSDRRWLDNNVPGNIRRDMGKLDYTRRPVYRYSDVNYVLLQFAVEAITGMGLDQYVSQEFYEPMGLRHLTFRPRLRHPLRQLVPTITDQWLERGKLQGFVHDEGAALLGGVAGHAGLFGNASDLGRLFQLLNEEGRYGDRQFLSPETVRTFTARNSFNHRALAFDRLSGGYQSVITAGASENTVGHTGFSGTCVWADPDNDLVFVLLTNRIHPDPSNVKLLQYGTRSQMHRELYRALYTYGKSAA